MNKGTRNTINKGKVIKTTAITEKTLNASRIELLNDSGIFVSVNSISLLNRLIILPIGVDSKNCILHLSILESILL